MKPTIVILNDYQTGYGGASNVAVNSAIGLANLGYQTILFSAVKSTDSSISHIPNLEVINLSGQDILNDPNRLRAAANGLWNFKARLEFDRLLSRLDPKNTIIHVHGWTKSLSSSPIKSAIDQSCNIVTSIHDYFLACPNGGFFNYKKEEHCPLKPMSKECIFENCDARNYGHKLWRITRQLIQQKVGLVPDQLHNFIYASDFSLQILKPFLPLNARFFQLDNPINITKSQRVPTKSNDALFFVGRLSREKGPVIFAQAAKETNSLATFIGDGPESQLVKDANPDAIMKGWLEPQELVEQLQKARCLVFPSICYEVSPLIVLEAAAVGIPAIVPSNTAATSLIVPNESGLIFERGNVTSLCRQIERIRNNDFVEYLSKNAYSDYWKNAKTMDRHLSRLLDIYQKMLE